MYILPRLPEESVTIEYKTTFSPRLGSSVCSFLNTIGGNVIIGIDERYQKYQNDRNIIHPNISVEDVRNSLAHSISPNPLDKIDIKRENWYGYEVVVITVPAPCNSEIYRFNDVVYYRIGATNRALSGDISLTEDLLRIRKNAKDIPVLKEYTPTNEKLGLFFNKTKKKNNVSYKRIGKQSKNTSFFYKYLSLDTVLTIFRIDQQKGEALQTLRFVEPPSWDDQFESHFYNANYSKVNSNKNNIPKLYASCFTHREESEPAWQIYNKGKDGIGKRCVQLRLNQIGLRNELVKNINNSLIAEGPVEYKSRYTINTLHLSTDKDDNTNNIFEEYFSYFTLDNYLRLLLLKRTAYEHEQEVRIFVIDENTKLGRKAKDKEKASHKDIKIDWLAVLEGIRVDPECSDIEMNLLQDVIYKLIDNSKNTKKKKKALKKKLIVTRYDVYKDEYKDIPIVIGETYKAFEKKLLNKKK